MQRLLLLLLSIHTRTLLHAFVPQPFLSKNKLLFTRNGVPRAMTTREEDLELTRQIIMREEDLELTRQIIMEHIAKLNKESSTGPEEDDKEKPLMVRVALGEAADHTPVWLFRQAGRHLPEYTAYKNEVGRNFWEMLKHPKDVAECTLQPLRRYKVDAAILFSDILVIPAAMGMEVVMPGGVGIQIPNPIGTPEDVKRYWVPESAEEAKKLVQGNLKHVLTSVELIKEKMEEEGFGSLPLIGFSATPFTLLFYMVGGSSKKNPNAGVDFLKNHPTEAKKLLRSLTDIVIEYVVAQVEHGADLLQFFEAMGMMIDEETFLEYELECLERIALEVSQRVGDDVPLMIFARGASYANAHLAKIPAYNVLTIDGSVSRTEIRKSLPSRVVLQGNYDPKELIIDTDSETPNTKQTVRQSVIDYLSAIGPQKLIANLGEGLGGKESPELVEEFVNAIHSESAKIIANEKNS